MKYYFYWNAAVFLCHLASRTEAADADDGEDSSSSNITDCPPPVVPSYHTIQKYPSCQGSSGYTGSTYSCSTISPSGNEWVTLCEGTVDQNLDVPSCSQNITSCAADQYYEVCERLGSFSSDVVCNADEHMFACWDKELDAWCRGHLEPRLGSWEDPVCPTEDLGGCDDFETFGIASTQCQCNSNEGEGFFACTKQGDTDPWCEGRLSKSQCDNSLGGSMCHESDNVDECPPLVAEDFEMVRAFCTDTSEESVMDDIFICKDYDVMACVGHIVGSQQIPPPCTFNITSCGGINDLTDAAADNSSKTELKSPVEYCELCTSKQQRFDQDYLTDKCGIPGTHGQNAFRCWDKIQDQWCQGYVIAEEDAESNTSWCPENITGTAREWPFDDEVIYDYPNGGDCYGMNFNSFGFGTYICDFPGGYQCRGKVVPHIVHDENITCPPSIVSSWDDVRLFCSTDFQCEGIGSGESGWTSNCMMSNCTSCATEFEDLSDDDDDDDDENLWIAGYYSCKPSSKYGSAAACAGMVNVSMDINLDLPECPETISSCSDEEYYAICDDPMGPDSNCLEEEEHFVSYFGSLSCQDQWEKDRKFMKDCDSQHLTFRCRPKNGGSICTGVVDGTRSPTSSPAGMTPPTKSPTKATSENSSKKPTNKPVPETALVEFQDVASSSDGDDASTDNSGSSKTLYIIMFGALAGACVMWKSIWRVLRSRNYTSVDGVSSYDLELT